MGADRVGTVVKLNKGEPTFFLRVGKLFLQPLVLRGAGVEVRDLTLAPFRVVV